MGEKVLLKTSDGVARIILNRPEALNAIDRELAHDFQLAVHRCRDDPEIRVVVVTGNGKAFCAGGDLKSIYAEDPAAELDAVLTYFHAGILELVRMNKPVVAAVNGTAAGAGFSLVLSCDIRLAVEKTKFTMAFARVGLTADSSGTYFLPRMVGIPRALELLFTGEVVTAEHLHDWGAVNQVYPKDRFDEEVDGFVRKLAQGPTVAIGRMKQLITRGTLSHLEAHLDLERETIMNTSRTEDAHEGYEAFLDKREPRFKGK